MESIHLAKDTTRPKVTFSSIYTTSRDDSSHWKGSLVSYNVFHDVTWCDVGCFRNRKSKRGFDLQPAFEEPSRVFFEDPSWQFQNIS